MNQCCNQSKTGSRCGRLKLPVAIIVMTIALAIPRFAHHTPDSKFYTALSGYFQGAVDRASLHPPYAYRPLLPLLASYGPSKSVDINFAIINVLFTIGAYFIFYRYLRLLLRTRAEVNVGLLLLIASFPTFNYASGVLTDPAGYLFLTAASYLLAKKRFLLFSVVTSFGVLAREALLVIVLAYLIYVISSSFSEPRPNHSLYYLLWAIPPICVCFAVRLYFADLPTFFWYPSMQKFLMNISRPHIPGHIPGNDPSPVAGDELRMLSWKKQFSFQNHRTFFRKGSSLVGVIDNCFYMPAFIQCFFGIHERKIHMALLCIVNPDCSGQQPKHKTFQ